MTGRRRPGDSLHLNVTHRTEEKIGAAAAGAALRGQFGNCASLTPTARLRVISMSRGQHAKMRSDAAHFLLFLAAPRLIDFRPSVMCRRSNGSFLLLFFSCALQDADVGRLGGRSLLDGVGDVGQPEPHEQRPAVEATGPEPSHRRRGTAQDKRHEEEGRVDRVLYQAPASASLLHSVQLHRLGREQQRFRQGQQHAGSL